MFLLIINVEVVYLASLNIKEMEVKRFKGPDDGLVPLKSVESGGFNSLGHTDNCHTNLFTDEELEKAMTILNP